MKEKRALLSLLLAVLLVGACTASPGTPATDQPTGVPTPLATATPAGGSLLVNPAAAAAARVLAGQLNLPLGQVIVFSIEPQQWPDGCLGLPNPGEMCAMHVVPGYRVTLKAGGESYTFRTDQTGDVVRQEQPVASPSPQATASSQGLILSAIAARLNVLPAEVQIVSTDAVDWPDACLGIHSSGQVCAQVITPGYKILAQVKGQQYEFHANQDGSIVRQVNPLAAGSSALIEWTARSGVCPGAAISAAQVTFSSADCLNGSGTQAPFPGGTRTAELAALTALYQPFVADTPAGKVVFNGSGPQVATPEEQRSVAEWASLVAQEAIAGRGATAQDLAFSWHRSGGIAGFCDDLAVYITGFAYPTSCKSGKAADLGRVRLSAAQLKQLYTWLDELKPFELDRSDPPAADAMSQQLVFSGTGTKPATEEDQNAMLALASQLMTQGK